jgi:beta-glucosidase-like glycosyl hydrolase
MLSKHMNKVGCCYHPKLADGLRLAEELRAIAAERVGETWIASAWDEETTLQHVPGTELLICVDHEGGRVQRFREGFTALPPMRTLGVLWERDREAGRRCARGIAYVAAAELAAHGVDFSFAPVLDLDYGSSSVIGDRALHYDPNGVGALAAELIERAARLRAEDPRRTTATLIGLLEAEARSRHQEPPAIEEATLAYHLRARGATRRALKKEGRVYILGQWRGVPGAPGEAPGGPPGNAGHLRHPARPGRER